MLPAFIQNKMRSNDGNSLSIDPNEVTLDGDKVTPPTPYFQMEAPSSRQSPASCWTCQPTIQQLCLTIEKLLTLKEYSSKLLAKKDDELRAAFKLLEEAQQRNEELLQLVQKKERELNSLTRQAEDHRDKLEEELETKQNRIISYLKYREQQLIDRIKDLEVELLGNCSKLEHQKLRNEKLSANLGVENRCGPKGERKRLLSALKHDLISSVWQQKTLDPNPEISPVFQELPAQPNVFVDAKPTNEQNCQARLPSESTPVRLHIRHHTEYRNPYM